MKKIFLCTIVMLSLGLVNTSAQQHLVFHIGGGVSSHYGYSTHDIEAFNVGLGYEYEFDQHWSIEPRLLFFSKGWKNKDETVPYYDAEGHFLYDENGNQVFGKKSVKSYTEYIDIPVLFNYYINLPNSNYINFHAGPYFAYGIGGKTETYGDAEQTGAKKIYNDHDTFDETDAHRFDMGLSVGVAYEFNRQFDVSLNTDFGLLKVKDTGVKNLTFYIGLAYKF